MKQHVNVRDMNAILEKVPPDFLKEEIRDGHFVSTQMKKVWAYQMDLTQEIFRVCEKYGLKCWLMYGSLLGAIRHKGFIPWDDDMDVCMFREDYDRLVQIAPQEMKFPYLFQTAYTDQNYIRGVAQMRNVQTAAIRPADIGQTFNQGIFVDIFVYDGVHPDPGYRQKQKIKRRIYCGLLGNTFYRSASLPKHILSTLLLRPIWGHGNRHRRLFRHYEDLFRRVSIQDVEDVAPLAFTGSTSMAWKKHWFDELVWTDFEYLRFPIPVEYHPILKTRYGDDYATPMKQPTCHGTVYFDPDRPASDVLMDIRSGKLKI